MSSTIQSNASDEPSVSNVHNTTHKAELTATTEPQEPRLLSLGDNTKGATAVVTVRMF